MKHQRVQSLLARVFLGLIVTMMAFIVIELAARPFINTRSPIERRFPVQHFRTPRPYVMFSGEPSAHDLNELGYPGPAPSVDKTPGEYRIFFLGGSTVVAGDPPICRLVERRFEREGLSRVRTYNFGVVSSVSSMELARILFEIADLEPDMVVMYNGGNDLLHVYDWDPRPGYPFNFVAYENNVLLKDVRDYPGLALLAHESAILRRCLRPYFLSTFVDLEAERERAGYLSSAWKEQIADTYVGNLVKARTMTAAFGADFVAFFQPLVYFRNTPTAEERELIEADPGEAAFALDMRDLLRSRFREAQGRGLPLVDLSAIHENETATVFNDPIHTRQDPKQRIADAIFDEIAPRVIRAIGGGNEPDARDEGR